MKISLFLAVGAISLTAIVQAQSTPPKPQAEHPAPTKATPSPEDTLKLAQQLMDVYLLVYKPLDWNEINASTSEVVADARKALGTEAPIIEVRTKESPRSTFQLKAAPLGRTLSSVATLTNATLWVLPGRLLIAAPESLTSAERDWIAQGLGGEWKGRNGGQWDAMRQLEKATLVVVGAQLKEQLATKGESAPTPTTLSKPPYEIGWAELNPTTQQHLLGLLKAQASMYAPPLPLPVLDSSVLVSFDDTKNNSLALSLSKPKPGSATERESLGNWRVSVVPPKPTK